MNGKVCIVTGGSAGIGLFTALEIARLGATVLIIGRNPAKCEAVVHRIIQETGNPSVSYLLADLSSQAQIRAAAEQFQRQFDHLDVLLNNAGGFFLRRQLTEDHLEMTFAVNHLAYFLLTNLLMEALQRSGNARVINVSSGSHQGQHLNLEDLQFSRHYNPLQAYGRSKLANILFTYELSRRMDGSPITTNALTPGLVHTEIWSKVNPVLTLILDPIIRRIGQTPVVGAQTSIYLATSPEVQGITSKYFADCSEIASSTATYDQETARCLWEQSASLVGL